MIRRSWARAASIEETLALWAASLREVKKRIRPLFGQERVARNAGLFLEGLLGDETPTLATRRVDERPWGQSGATTLEAHRTYRLADGKIAQVAVNTHPASRFRHSMTMRRTKG